MNEKTGGGYRLPSDAEWEYAARAGMETSYPWGNDVGSNHANCLECGGPWNGRKTAPTGSFPANGFGLHDMAGNVWEWTQDCWNDSYNGAPADGRAWASGDCSQRVVRGGSWGNLPVYVRSASRGKWPDYFGSHTSGFRLAQDITISTVDKKQLRQEQQRITLEKERQKKETIQTLLSGAQEDINALRLTSPDGNNALEKYQKILELDSENEEAKQGLQNIVDKYIALAHQAANSEEHDKAIANLDKADKILPDSENIKKVREEIGLKVKEKEEQRLAEIERQRQEEEQKGVEEEKIQIDDDIRIALLADGIDLSELPPVQQEAYIEGKRRQLDLKNENSKVHSYLNQIENKSSCLQAGDVVWDKGAGRVDGNKAETNLPKIKITNVCDEKIWTKLYIYIGCYACNQWGDEVKYTFYKNILFDPKEMNNVQLYEHESGLWYYEGLNIKDIVNININSFSIPYNQYKDFWVFSKNCGLIPAQASHPRCETKRF